MSIAAKHLDPIIGIDVHIVQPPGPVPPVPIPHPHVGMLLDPADYLPGASTVNINGLPRATAGTSGMAMPPHIPMGGVFVKPPTNESTVFMGSMRVKADGEPLSFLGLPVLTCQDVGMPAPPRKKRKAPKTLLLPTTVVLSIPAGPPVLVGGPPTILMPGIESLIAPLAKGMVRARKALAKKSKLFRKVMKQASRSLHKKAAKAMDKLGLGDRARNRVHRAICTVTGHPVDVATGKVFTEMVDFELPGPIPLRWERVWFSTSRHRGALGHGWHHAYDLALIEVDGAVAVRLADGRTTAFPALTEGASHFDRREKLTLSRRGRGYALAGKDGLTYHFSAAPTGGDPFVLVAVEDRSGNRLGFEHDRRGWLAAVKDSGGRALKVACDDQGRIVEIRGPHPTEPGRTMVLVSYAYDRLGNLVQATDAMGQSMRYEYRQGLLTRETNRNGLSFHFEYDGQDEKARCLRTWGDGGIYDHKITYDVIASTTVVEDSLGHKTTYHHRAGLVWKTIDPAGGVHVTKHDEHDELVAEVDPLGRATLRAYDDRGNLAKVTGPDGVVVALVHDGRDLLVSATDANGGAWRWEHDERGRLVARTDPMGAVTRYEWGAHQLAAVVDPMAAPTRFEWDAAGTLASVRTADGAVTRWVHDALGRVVTAVDPQGNVQRRTLDALGRAVRVDEPDGNVRELAYDPEGNVVHAKDRQREVRFTYAGMNRLVARTEAKTTVGFEYDTEEQLVAVRNEHGLVYRFERGPTGEVVVESGFDGLRRVFARDKAGRVMKVDRPAGAWTEYAYDAADRVVTVKYSDGSEEGYRYRADGALMGARNGTGVLTFERDALGRVVKEASGDFAVESTFDARGLRTGFRSTLKADVRIERNIMGDVVAMECGGGFSAPRERGDARPGGGVDAPLKLSFERDLAGLEIARSLPGGVEVRWQRDKLGRPLTQEVRARGQVTRSRQYTWSFDERLQRVIDVLRGPVTYSHDQLGNLVAAQYADGMVERRLPDAVGNLFRTEDRRDRSYGPAGQLLEERTAAGLTRYEYDAEGNRVRKIAPGGAVWEYEWNGGGMLTRVIRPDGAPVDFGYDPLGRRSWKRYRGKTTRWAWDGHVPLHEWVEVEPGAAAKPGSGPEAQPRVADVVAAAHREASLNEVAPQGPPRPDEGSPADPITWLFDPETFTPVAKLAAGERFGIVTDHLGTPTAMYDGQGHEVWSAEIGVWGTLRDVKGPRQAVPFRWPGQYEDEETGLYYNRFRYYDPEAGEYVSQDPIGLAGGLSAYAYTGNPAVRVDPLGLKECGNTWNQFQRLYAGHHGSRAKAAEAYNRLKRAQSPWPDGYSPRREILAPGTRFRMAMSPGQPSTRPGAFATPDDIPDVASVRNQLAVKQAWKPDIDRVVTYEVTKPIEVLRGPVGPQIDEVANRVLPGGGQQIQLLGDPAARMNALQVVSEVPIF